MHFLDSCSASGANAKNDLLSTVFTGYRSPIHARRIGMEAASRRMMWHGFFLFLLGLLTGFAEAHVANVRMGLAAHLEGVMNGIFLIAVGAIWANVRLAPTAKTAAFWLVLYGTYLNWLFTLLAAVFGTGALSPITAPGRSGLPWQESLVTAGFMSVGIAIVLASVMILWGLRSKVSA
jgi:(hydroxyamino)benzene mutase